MAVFTEVSDADVDAFLRAYDIGRARALKGIAEGTENSTFLLITEQGPHILTLYERRVARAELPYFLGLMEHLAAQGVPCPLPVPARDGERLRTLNSRPAAILTFLEGQWPRRPSPEQCAAVGQSLAALHAAGTSYAPRRANALGLEAWDALLARLGAAPTRLEEGLDAELRAEIVSLRATWPTNLPAGVIHADLFPDNVFFSGPRLSGIIDFYFACTDAFAYDLAICLNAWCFEDDGGFNITKAQRLVTGYGRVRPLTAHERAVLPVLARGAALRFLLTRLDDWLHPAPSALVRPKDPRDYLSRLRFHRGVGDAAAYGLGPSS